MDPRHIRTYSTGKNNKQFNANTLIIFYYTERMKKNMVEGFSMLSNVIPINNSLTLYAKHNKQYGSNAEGKILKNAVEIIWHGL